MLKMLRGAGSIPSWNAGDLNAAREALQKMGIVTLFTPPDVRRDCRFIQGTIEEQAEKPAEVFKALG